MAIDFNLMHSRLEQEWERLTKELEHIEASNCPAGDRGGSWFGNRDEQANETTELRKQQSSKRHLRDFLAEVVTCPPKTEPVLVLDWQLKKKGVVNGQEGIQTRADHR
jgi:hypothetical protein